MHKQESIETLTAEAVLLLREMVAIPSPSFSEDAICTHISKWLSDRRIHHERIGNDIIAEHIVDPAGPTLMLCAHTDTVAPCDGYDFDPYTPDYETAAKVIGEAIGSPCSPDGIIAGLGSNDDGASVVSMIAVYRYFCSHPEAHTAGLNLTLVLTCEEERSGKGGMAGLWHNRLNRIDHAIIGEPTGMKAATSERGLLVIDATAYGISGHAARNEGRNALYIALEDIEKIRNHRFTKKSTRMGEVNINVTQINAGTAHNVIPDRCDFVIDIRPTEQYANEEILEELQSICKSELKPRNLTNRSSATFAGSPLQKAAEALGIETFSSPTTSDWMRITCDAVKMGPGDSSRSHRKNEFVFVSEIRTAIETYIDYINTI